MKQVVQDLASGAVRLTEVPPPIERPGGVLVRNAYSVISLGTERSKIEFGSKSLLGKAVERPDQVRLVVEAVRREGLMATYRKVRARLATLAPLGYSCAGVVEAVGSGVEDLRVGDAVACAGAGYATHAERVWVPKNLVARVPDGVCLEHAAFTTLGAIAMHGVRQASGQLGESVVVIGLGLLGQLTIQLVRAAGMRAIGIDVTGDRVALAGRFGALALHRRDRVVAAVRQATGGRGADCVIITAASRSDDPIRLAGALARDRGRVVVVGAVPINVPRTPYYEKELEVRLSRSYGPGRYDPDFEERGRAYPAGYVRWTERDNLVEFLRLVHDESVQIAPLITHRFAFADVEKAYASLKGTEGGRALGVVLRYEDTPQAERRTVLVRRSGRPAWSGGGPGVALVGAGNFATATLIPALRRAGAELIGVTSASGITARSVAENFGFRYATRDVAELLADRDIRAVVIATRHDTHARLAAQALAAGKCVFVEKPLAIDESSLREVLAAAQHGPPLAVGFNRRWAPATRFIATALGSVAGARVVHIRVNAGAIPPENWVHDPRVGGGRLVGEGCHFIDLAIHLAGAPAVAVSATGIGGADPDAPLGDNVQVTLRCANGSLATIVYTSKGEPRAGKERVEVFAGGASAILDDFRRAEVWGESVARWKGTQDKGHAALMEAFMVCVRDGGPSPLTLETLENSSLASLVARRALVNDEVLPVAYTPGGEQVTPS